MSRLATHVHVADDGGVVHVFGPDDEVPDWAAEKIDNPAAWADDDAAAAPKKTAPRRRPKAEPADE